MKIDVIFTARHLEEELVLNKTVVAIDVFRATTVITTALYNGAKRMKAFRTIEELLKFKEYYNEEDIITGGERNIVKIEGFNLGNSPLEYTKDVVNEKEILFTTSNGTVAIEKSKTAKDLYIMSFLNINAVTKVLLNCEGDLLFVCSGTGKTFSMEDVLCASVCIDFLTSVKEMQLTDAARFTRDFYRNSEKDILGIIEKSTNYNILKERGCSDDTEYALTLNLLDTVPFYRDGWIYSL